MRTKGPRCCILLLAFGLLPVLLPVPAAAQGETGETGATGEAAQAFDVGVRLLREGNWAGALAAFERAYRLEPHYPILFNIGYCLKQLNRYPEALDAFERYLREGGTDVAPERRAEAEQMIGDLRLFLSRVRLVVSPGGAEVRVDGHPRGTSPLAEPLVLGAGHHAIDVTAPGYRDVHYEFDLGGNEDRDVVLSLERVAGAAADPDRPEVPSVQQESVWYDDYLGWTLAGVGVAAAGVGGYFLWSASDKDSQADSTLDVSAEHALRDDAGTAWIIGGIVGGVGGAALITGIILLAVHGDAESPPPAEGGGAEAALFPVVGPWGLGLAGTF